MSFQAQGLLCQYLSEDMSGIDLGSLDLPQIEKDLVKIKISHASLNFPDWLMSQGYVAFLRDIGSHFRVNEMLRMETYKARLDRGEGLSFIEGMLQRLLNF